MGPRSARLDGALSVPVGGVPAAVWPASSGRVGSTEPGQAYAPTAAPELVAAALVHDAPDFAQVEDLDGLLTRQLSPGVTRLVRGLEALHDHPTTTDPTRSSSSLLWRWWRPPTRSSASGQSSLAPAP